MKIENLAKAMIHFQCPNAMALGIVNAFLGLHLSLRKPQWKNQIEKLILLEARKNRDFSKLISLAWDSKISPTRVKTGSNSQKIATGTTEFDITK